MEEPSLIAIIVKLGLVLLLVLANGYFVAAEFAVVSVANFGRAIFRPSRGTI
jgi:hypothetical protein